MATAQTYYCPICSYTKTTCAGPSATFFVVMDTFRCLDCNDIMDIATHRIHYEPSHEIDDDPEPLLLMQTGERSIKEIYPVKCSECEGSNLEVWDSALKPCPKCGTSLTIDANGFTFFLD